MKIVLKGSILTECLCYLDDVLVMVRTWQEHNERLERVLTASQNAGLTLNPRKCLFGAKHIKFVGYMININGVSANPKKIDAIMEFSRPDSPTKN